MISDESLQKLKDWLGEDGLDFFRKTKEKHGEIAAVYMEGRLPHCVHFREGMQVRNFLRRLPEYKDSTSIDLDDCWVEIIEEAMK